MKYHIIKYCNINQSLKRERMGNLNNAIKLNETKNRILERGMCFPIF